MDGENGPDVLITGNTGSKRIANLYVNDGSGGFTLKLTPFPGVDFSSIAFADVNENGHQDVLITGWVDGNGRIAKLYLNDGEGNFTEEEGTPFSGVNRGSIAFADVDGKNGPDVLITGNTGSKRIANLYLNNGSGGFSLKATPFPGVDFSSIAFADVNENGHQDVLITGWLGSSSSSRISKLYLNDGEGVFTEKESTPFPGVSAGDHSDRAIAFANVDGEKGPDVLITGWPGSSERIAKLYLNDGSGSFTEKMETPFPEVSSSSIAFADVDKDGYQDVLITGQNTDNEGIASLYLNDGSGNFTEKMETPFPEVSSSSIAFSDVDGDDDPDVLITGYTGSERIAKLYINDQAPVFSSGSSASVPENITAVLTVSADDDSETLTYSVSGGADEDSFSIDQNTGDLTFNTPPDFEAMSSDAGNNIYEVEVTVSDGVSDAAQTITVTVTNVEGVQITSEGTKSVAENTAAVLTVAAVTEAASGGTITYSLSGGSDMSKFSINENSGALTFTSAPDFETPGSANNTNIYVVAVTASDGDNSITQTITVTVTDVNETPAFSSGSFTLTIGEDAATDANVGAAVTATDPDEDGVTYTLTGEDSGDFSIDRSTGQITVANPLDRETISSYTLTVTATDDAATNSLSATAAVTITVTDVNDNAPEITSDNAKSVAENTTAVLTVVATDADANTTFTYSISGGSDRSSFGIAQNSGALTFNTAPDFEAPGSANNTNVYEVEVTASDGGNSDVQTITITVTDVDEVLGVPSAEGMELYPNPASDHFRLSGISDEWIGVSLIGMTGHLVRSYPVSKDGLYDISGLSEGLFFVVIEGDGGRKAVGRIVIRK